MTNLSTVLLLIFILMIIPRSTSEFTDTISPNRPLKDGDILLSGEKTFALGFFSPSNSSTNRYVGVWYNKIQEQTVIWIANRDNPVNDTSGILTVNRRRGLVLYGNNNNKNRTSPVWSSNISVRSRNNTNLVAKLQDIGNLVLVSDNNNNTILWQGFDYLTDTYLPYMKLGLDLRTGLDRFLTCWKSPEDPGSGNCTYRIDPTGYPQLSSYMNRIRIFRTGSWTGNRWTGIPRMGNGSSMFKASFVNDRDEVSVVYVINSKEIVYSRLVIDSSGVIRRSTWQEDRRKWTDFFHAPDNWCDNYAKCGSNSNCDPSDSREFECTCLPGFEPQSNHSTWDLSSDASGDCVRKRGTNVCRNGEGFVKVARVKLPDTSNARVDMGLSLAACERRCLGDCNCTAYSVADEIKGFGCLTWHGDLVDTRAFSGNVAGLDLFLRVDSITLAKYARKSKRFGGKVGKLAILLGSLVAFIAFMFFIIWFLRRKMRDIKKSEIKHLFHSNTPNYLEESVLDETLKDSDIPLFDLHIIAKATSYFSYDNKLGEGGFGAVYKGVLPDGREIAVKRLSKCSGQGNQEFRNEVILIAKLQHRNLVRILGCCFKKQEKMLIYEYLPNKSLDFFVFDESRRKMLDWKKRFEIICGIARGMLYLHQDSRLRIIHRDLKASNILLDAAMNPKISDFGLARIFGGDQIEACTKRIVGTYGYMSPEYAMDGLFSIKSDVYSFGVLLLEIIIGRKKIDYYNEKPDSNLVSHIWNLWKEDRVLEIVDSSLKGSFGKEDVLIKRCVQIGFLCVQDNPNDRPTMSTVVSMLGNDLALPYPKQPAFVFKKNYNYDIGSRDASTSEGRPSSINTMTCSMVEPR